MPTGYTADVQKGITFKQFAMNCARAMGALVMMRDEPSGAEIPEAFPPSTYNRDQLPRLRDELGKLRAMNVAEIEAAAADDFKKQTASYQERMQQREDLRVKYQAILDEVNAWTPPTPEHEGFKQFMQEQLTGSIKFDCDLGKFDTEPAPVDPQQWIELQLQSVLRDIEYNTKADAEEVERTQKRNDWISALRTSLADKT